MNSKIGIVLRIQINFPDILFKLSSLARLPDHEMLEFADKMSTKINSLL